MKIKTIHIEKFRGTSSEIDIDLTDDKGIGSYCTRIEAVSKCSLFLCVVRSWTVMHIRRMLHGASILS